MEIKNLMGLLKIENWKLEIEKWKLKNWKLKIGNWKIEKLKGGWN